MQLTHHDKISSLQFHKEFFSNFEFLIIPPEYKWHLEDNIYIIGADNDLVKKYNCHLNISCYEKPGYLNISCRDDFLDFSIKGFFQRADIALIVTYFHSYKAPYSIGDYTKNLDYLFRPYDIGVTNKKILMDTSKISFTETCLFNPIDYNDKIKKIMTKQCLKRN